MRIGLTFEDGSQALATRTQQLLSDQGCDVVCVGCGKRLVDKLAAGDRFDLIIDCCCQPQHTQAVSALGQLYEIATAPGKEVSSAIESGMSITEISRTGRLTTRRPHMLEMAGAGSEQV
jgi:hypothetical protein